MSILELRKFDVLSADFVFFFEQSKDQKNVINLLNIETFPIIHFNEKFTIIDRSRLVSFENLELAKESLIKSVKNQAREHIDALSNRAERIAFAKAQNYNY